MGTLYTYSVNVKTLEVEPHVSSSPDYDDYPTYASQEEAIADDCCFGGGAGYAEYNDFSNDCVYAESLVSLENAKRLVYEKCQELRDRFASAMNKMETEGN